MKRLVSLIICVMLLLSTLVTVNAKTGSVILSAVTEEYKEEIQEVKTAVENSYSNWNSYLGSDVSEIDFDLMYQCYDLKDYDIVSAYKKHDNFGSNISDSYVWMVPNYTSFGEVEVVSIENSKYGWKIRSGQELRKYSGINEINIAAFYDCILDEYPDADSDSFRVILCSDYDCRFIYFTCDDVEYLTPYFYSEDPEWAKSGEFYTAANIIAKITENYNMGINNASNGIVAFIKNNVDYIIIGSTVLLAVVVVSGVIIKKKKNGKESVS